MALRPGPFRTSWRWQGSVAFRQRDRAPGVWPFAWGSGWDLPASGLLGAAAGDGLVWALITSQRAGGWGLGLDGAGKHSGGVVAFQERALWPPLRGCGGLKGSRGMEGRAPLSPGSAPEWT